MLTLNINKQLFFFTGRDYGKISLKIKGEMVLGMIQFLSQMV